MKKIVSIAIKVIPLLMMLYSCRYVREWDDRRDYHPHPNVSDFAWDDSSFFQADRRVLVYDDETFFYKKFEQEDSICLPMGEYYVMMYQNDTLITLLDTSYYDRTIAKVVPVSQSQDTIANLNNYLYCGVGLWKIAPSEAPFQSLTWHRIGVKLDLRLQMEADLSIRNARASLSGIADEVYLYNGNVISEGNYSVRMRTKENTDGSVLLEGVVLGFSTDSYGAYRNNRLTISFGLLEQGLFYSGYLDMGNLITRIDDGRVDTTITFNVNDLTLHGVVVPWENQNEGHSFFDQDVK